MSRRVLIVQFSASRDGSTISGLQIADGLRDAGWVTHVTFGHPGPMEQVYQDHGHSTEVVQHKNWLRRTGLLHGVKDWWSEFGKATEFDVVMNAFQPTLVYVNTAASLAGAVAGQRAGLPVIWHLRELFDDVGGELRCAPVLRPLAKRAFARFATALVTNSCAVRDNLLAADAGAKASVIPNAVEERYFGPKIEQGRARKAFGFPRDALVIGVPGTLRPVKGHLFFLDVAKRVKRNHPNSVFVFTGDGTESYERELRAKAVENGLDGAVRFTGTLPDLLTFFAACDLVCIPSQSETFGRVATEAMAANVPVIASDVGGLKEVLEHNATGLLLPYGDIDIWEKELSSLLCDSPRRSRFVAQARITAETNFHESTYQSRIKALTDEVVNSRI